MKTTINITEFKYPSGTIGHRVSGMVAGKFRRQNFADPVHAMTAKQSWERENLNMPALSTVTMRGTLDQAAEAEACFRRVADSKFASLSEAVDFAIRNYRPAQKQLTVNAAFLQFMRSKRDVNCKPATLRKLEDRLSRLRRLHGDALIHELQGEQMRDLVIREGSGLHNRETDRRCLANFFNWAIENKVCAESPMKTIKAITIDQGEPVVLSLPEVRRMLSAATSYRNGRLLPYVVLGLFCAIRPEELSRVSWSAFNLERGLFTVGADIAKMRDRRGPVEIPANALDFLRPAALKGTAIYPPANFTHDFQKLKKLAGFGTPTPKHPNLKPWTQDVLRHTGISHYYARHEDESKTARWAGNSPAMIHKHYKALIDDPQDVADFYAITPASLSVPIVPLVQAA